MSKPILWTSAEADDATRGRSSQIWRATGVSIDSRSVEPGDLFIALIGPNFDGHEFAVAAFERGAAAVVASRPLSGLQSDKPVLQVRDTFKALNALARAARNRSRARIIAVTGSVGKTGVKEALKLVLEEQGVTAGTIGNLNNEIGTPLSLARMAADTAYGVFELGMSRPGELSRLSQLVRPEVAVITTIASAHTAFFDSVGAIADAKAEIFDGMMGGTAVLNRDNAYFATLAVAAFARGVEHIIGFGAHPEATARVVESKPDADFSLVTADIEGRRLEYRVGLPGRHWVINSLAVLAAARAAGANLNRAGNALGRLIALKGRGERHRIVLDGGEIEVIDDSYNASPASVRAAIETLSMAETGPAGRRIAVLGDMLELGADSPRMHAGLARSLIERNIDLVFTAGDDMAHLRDALPAAMRGGHAVDSEALVPLVMSTVRAGDVIVVKGSLGSRMGRIVDALVNLQDLPPKAVNG